MKFTSIRIEMMNRSYKSFRSKEKKWRRCL